MLTVCISSRSLKSQMLPQLGVILPNGFQQWPQRWRMGGVRVCRKINMMVSDPKPTSSYQTSDTRNQTHNANLEYKNWNKKRHEQKEIKTFVSYLQRFKTKKAHEWSRYNSHGFAQEGEKEGECEGWRGKKNRYLFFLNKSIMKENETRL